MPVADVELLGGARWEPPISTLQLTAFSSEGNGPTQDKVDQRVTTQELVLGTTTIVSTSLTVGYVVWLVRGGTLFASLLVSIPTWASFDPLPILDSFASQAQDDDEDLSLAEMATGGR